MNVLSLFSGYGGLELGIKQVFPGSRTVCYCEIEPYPQKVLLKRMMEGQLDAAPIWPDVFSLRGCWFTEAGIKIDCISGGFPCQPFSIAGKREGEEDERYLFPEITRLARELGFLMLFLENVYGLISIDKGRTFGQILGKLTGLGYDIKWGVVRAADAGALHARARVFIMANP